ncbi:alpha/beta fold hydrolase [Streptomyces sp. NPDC059224]|uniref:alpha/beta fold hydrolase n=1 Tax=Streptomyces sp. NPDC059224 TaxID=3346775 RepID=UPI00367FF0D5
MNIERESTGRRWNETAIRGTVLAWTEADSGPIAVWAHPLCSSSLTPEAVGTYNWEPIAAGGRRLIRYDARGHGRSGGRPKPADFSFENLARDLLALIDVLSPQAPVAGIGMSLGAATLLHAAVLAPDRFEKLVLSAPPTAWDTRAAQKTLYASLAELVADQGPAAVHSLLRDAPVPAPRQGVPGPPLPDDVDERLLPSLLRGVGDSDLPPREFMARLRLPVLILPWADDPTHPVSTAAELASPHPRLQAGDCPDHRRHPQVGTGRGKLPRDLTSTNSLHPPTAADDRRRLHARPHHAKTASHRSPPSPAASTGPTPRAPHRPPRRGGGHRRE